MTLKTEKRLKQAGKSTYVFIFALSRICTTTVLYTCLRVSSQRATPRRRLYDSAEANPAWSLPG